MRVLGLLKDTVKKSTFLTRISLQFINWRNKRIRSNSYRKFGVEALQKFVSCMDSNSIEYTLAFGSILGAIREHGFIKHDLDIDTFVWIDQYSQRMVDCIINAGFKWKTCYLVDEGKLGREDTFEYHGVTIDVFYLYPAIDEYPYCCDFLVIDGNQKKRLPRRIEIPVSRERRQVLFENEVHVWIPNNAEQICEFRYGPNYMTPDPQWHWQSEKNSIHEWPEMAQCTRYLPYPQNIGN